MYRDNNHQPWKVKDLIRELSTLDPEAPIEIPIQTWSKVYPSGYFTLSWVEKAHNGAIRLWVHLGRGFIISKRSK